MIDAYLAGVVMRQVTANRNDSAAEKRHPMLRISAFGPEVGLPDGTSAGF